MEATGLRENTWEAQILMLAQIVALDYKEDEMHLCGVAAERVREQVVSVQCALLSCQLQANLPFIIIRAGVPYVK
jgi:hypothetical protein